MVVTFVSFLLLAKLDILDENTIDGFTCSQSNDKLVWCGGGDLDRLCKKIFSDVLQTSLIMMKETRNVGSPEMTGRLASMPTAKTMLQY